MPRPKRKYRSGYTVVSIDDLAYGLTQGKWYYWGNKVLHPGFFRNMTLSTIMGAVKAHNIHVAIDQHKEHSDKLIQEIKQNKKE